jgi:DNA polymerase III alpha subunit
MGQADTQGYRTMKFQADIDIDFGDREQVLEHIKHIPASIHRDGEVVPHNTGVYVNNIPKHPITRLASIDHKEAEQRGYVKLDFLNVSVYQQIHSEEELDVLMATEPPWHRLQEPEFVEKIIHIGNHYDIVKKLQPRTVDEMAAVLAIIRPSKRYLLNKDWATINQEVWTKPSDGSYYFKKSHATSYAYLVVVHMNLVHLSN